MAKGRTGQRVRLYVRGTILGFKRSKSNQYESTSLVQVEGVNTKEDVAWYGVAATEEASSALLSSPGLLENTEKDRVRRLIRLKPPVEP